MDNNNYNNNNNQYGTNNNPYNQYNNNNYQPNQYNNNNNQYGTNNNPYNQYNNNNYQQPSNYNNNYQPNPFSNNPQQYPRPQYYQQQNQYFNNQRPRQQCNPSFNSENTLSPQQKSSIYSGSLFWLAVGFGIIGVVSAIIIAIITSMNAFANTITLGVLAGIFGIIASASFISMLCGLSKKIKFKTSYTITRYVFMILLLIFFIPMAMSLFSDLGILNDVSNNSPNYPNNWPEYPWDPYVRYGYPSTTVSKTSNLTYYAFVISTVVTTALLWICWGTFVAIKRKKVITAGKAIGILFGIVILPAWIFGIVAFVLAQNSFGTLYIGFTEIGLFLLFIFACCYFGKIKKIVFFTSAQNAQSDIKFWGMWTAQEILSWYIIVLLLVLLATLEAIVNEQYNSKVKKQGGYKPNKYWYSHSCLPIWLYPDPTPEFGDRYNDRQEKEQWY